MEREPSWITAEQVLAFAQERGCYVSDAMRRRYHLEGVLPRPRMVGLGRGRGRVAMYPSGSERQLARLQELLEQDRSTERARFQLWLERFPVETYWIRDHLRQTLGQMDDLVAEHVADTLDEPHERVDQLLHLASTGRLSSPVLGAARRRLGREAFATIPALLLDAFAGFSTVWGDGEARDLARATGVNLDFLRDALRAIGDSLVLGTLKATVEATTDEDLRRARDEFLVFSNLVRQAAAAMPREAIGGSPKQATLAPDQILISVLGRILDALLGDAALPFTLWLTVRRQPSWKSAIDLITSPYLHEGAPQAAAD